MHMTGGNAIRLQLTNLQTALKNLQTQAKDEVRSMEPGLWSRNSNFGLLLQASKIFAPAPERLGPLKTKNHYIIFACWLLYKIRLLNENSNFRLRLHNTIVWLRAPAPQPWLEPTVFGNEYVFW